MEHLLAKERVAGSIPVSRFEKITDTKRYRLFFLSLFAFCWQWMDDFYISLINVGNNTSSQLLVNLVGDIPLSLQTSYAGTQLYETAIRNTCGLLIIAPLVVLYAFCQNFLVQGIEHSGIAN